MSTGGAAVAAKALDDKTAEDLKIATFKALAKSAKNWGNQLDANTTYTFVVTGGVKDTTGAPFIPFQMSFTTGTHGGTTARSLSRP